MKAKTHKKNGKRDTEALIHQLVDASRTDVPTVPVLFSVDEAFEVTGISKWSWRAWAYSGKIESCKIGKLLKIPGSEIARLIAEGKRPRVD